MASTGGLNGSDPKRRDSLICFNPICSDKAVIRVAKSDTVKGCATFHIFFNKISAKEILGPRSLRICRVGERVLLEFETEPDP